MMVLNTAMAEEYVMYPTRNIRPGDVVEAANMPATAVDTVARKTRGAQSNQCAIPKETDLRMRTWMRIRAETMRKHVWRRVSASQRREVVPMLGVVLCVDEELDHWVKASQRKTLNTRRSQSASHM